MIVPAAQIDIGEDVPLIAETASGLTGSY